MILQALPDIPRWYTGLAEWSAALVYILLLRPRFTGWKRPTLIAAALPTLIGIQVFMGSLPLSFWTIGMATAVLSIFGFIYLSSETTAKDAGYLTARAFVLAELVASLQWQLWVHWLPEHPTPALGTMAFTASIGFLAVAYSAGFTSAYFAEKRNIPRGQTLAIEGHSLVTALAIALGTFLVSNLSFITTATPFSGRTAIDIFYIRTLVDLAGYVALYTQQSHLNQVNNAVALAETQAIMRAQRDQYLQSKRNIGELNRIHHDLKHYVAAIRDEDSAALRSTYLSHIEDSITGYESQIETGNSVLDIILNSKMERCLREDISMTIVVDGTAVEFMDVLPLSSLFGNALDNAIDACRKVEEKEKRLIKVSVYTKMDFVLIRFENYTDANVAFVEGLPQTTKRNKTRHGYGVLNMRNVVENYNGSMTINLEENWFTVRILLPRQ